MFKAKARNRKNLFNYSKEALGDRTAMSAMSIKFFRDITNRTIFGWWWVFIRLTFPVIGISVLVFQLNLFEDSAIPYILLILSGMIIWSVVDLSFVYGVRTFIRMRRFFSVSSSKWLTGVIASFSIPIVGSALMFVIFIIACFYVQTPDSSLPLIISAKALLVPAFFLMSCFFLLGLLCILAPICFFARDIRLAMPILRQLLFVVTPVVYPLEALDEKLASLLLTFNPLAVNIEVIRWALFNVTTVENHQILVALIVQSLTLFTGAWFIFKIDGSARLLT